MRKSIKNYIIILSSLLWVNSLAHSGMVTDKVEEAIAIKTTDKGRQALLEEMGKYSAQLEKDIERYETIKVQGVEILTEKTKKIDKEHKANTIYIDILTALGRNCPKNVGCKANIGPFSAAEIMYTMVQNFLSIPMVLHHNFYGETNFNILNSEWAPVKSRQTVSIEFSKKYAFFGDDLLIVNYNENKQYVAMKKLMNNNLSPKSRWLENNSKTIFNLTTGEVEFTFSYNDSYLPRLKRSYEITTTTLDIKDILKDIGFPSKK